MSDIQHLVVPSASLTNGIVYPLPVAIDSADWPVMFYTADPTILSADDLTGTVINATDGTLSGIAAQVHQWYADGIEIEGETGASFTPDTSYNGKIITRGSYPENWAGVRVTSNGILVTDPDVDEDWPADITASLVEYSEIRDPLASGAGVVGGRRNLILGAITVPAGFELHSSSGTVSGGTPPGTDRLPSTTTLLDTEYAVNTVLYFTLFWYRISDGATQVAFAASGTTAGAALDADLRAYPRALSAISGNATRGQLGVTILGFEGAEPIDPTEWGPIDASAVTASLGYTLPGFNMLGDSPTDFEKTGNCFVAQAYSSYTGVASSDARVLQSYRNLISNSNMPAGHQGPASIKGSQTITFFHLVKDTPRMFVGGAGEIANALTAAERTKGDLVVKGLLLSGAYMASDNVPVSPSGHPQGSGHDLYLTGFATDVNPGSIGPNISQGAQFSVINAACYFGVTAASAYLENTTMTSFRAELVAAGFSTSSNMYRVFNWRNEGLSDTQAAAYYRSQGSARAPTDSVIHATWRTWRHGGVPISDFGGILYLTRKTNARGWYSLFRYTAGVEGAGTTAVGRVNSGIGGTSGNGYIGAGIGGDGKIVAGAASIPYLGTLGCMIYEHSGRDAGGPRSSMNYANWSYRPAWTVLISMELANAIPHGNTDWDDGLNKLRLYKDVYDYCVTQGWRSYAVGGGSGGGAGGPTVYNPDSSGNGWYNAINDALADAVIDKVTPA